MLCAGRFLACCIWQKFHEEPRIFISDLGHWLLFDEYFYSTAGG